jgi:hypothetical protein
MRLRFFVVAAPLVGCAPTYVVTSSPAVARAPERQPVAGKSEGLNRALALQADARALSSVKDFRHHEPEVKLLREMAATIEALPSHPTEKSRRIREQADRIEKSPITSKEHQVWAKDALNAALESLPGTHEKAQTAVNAIDDKTLFLQQRETVDTAIGAVADAIVATFQQQPAA